jgi:hypothetical protein
VPQLEPGSATSILKQDKFARQKHVGAARMDGPATNIRDGGL